MTGSGRDRVLVPMRLTAHREMAVVLFNFILRPTADIEPWGAPDKPSLSWFGLSDGWYWLSLGDDEVFRGCATPPDAPPYVDYQVVRLWEDVLDLVPLALTPVTRDAAAMVGGAPLAWARRADEMLDQARDDDLDQVVDTLDWWRSRRLDAGHLSFAPRVWFWRVGDEFHAAWVSQPQGADLWAPVKGFLQMPVDAFLNELRDFDARFMGAMRERVQRLRSEGGRAGVHIDLDHLEHEQTDREQWLSRALERVGIK